jgi:DNA-binding transcriptional regulator YiaG
VIAVSRSRPTPEEVIPDTFPEEWDADTVEGALEKAEKAPSTTPGREKKRCPAEGCLSTKIQLKTGVGTRKNEKKERYKCNHCSFHTNNPLPPRAEFSVRDPVCPRCHSERLRNPPEGVDCLDCGGHFDQATNGSKVTMSQSTRATFSTYRFPTGDELREAREDLNLDPRDLDGCGSYGSTVLSWERGDSSPTLWRLRALVGFYEVVDGHRRAERLADALDLADGGNE